MTEFIDLSRKLRGAARGWAARLIAVSLIGCSAEVAQKTGMRTPVSPTNSTSAGGTPVVPEVQPIALDPNNATNPPLGAAEALAPSTRFTRLTHIQWENSVRDLFGLDSSTAFAKDFRADPLTGAFLFSNNSESLEADSSLWQSYQGAAAKVAEVVVGDAARLATVLPPANSDVAARARQFITDFGARVYRRPLTGAEIDRYAALFTSAKGLYDALPDFESGVRMTIETLLQSPHFLYRVEASTAKHGDLIPLSAFELATRLSYALWDTTPDPALLADARNGTLSTSEAVAAQSMRLLESPRARPVLVSFNAQLFEVQRYSMINPSATAYPNISAGFAQAAEQELRLFSEDLYFTKSSGVAGLFTSNDSFVNDELAKVYGLSGSSFTQAFVPVTLPAKERRGILTQVGFLASHANSVDPDPIHRGVFIANRLLCRNIGAPPGVIPPMPPPGTKTNRQRVSDHTEQPGSACAACHGAIINPLGFPFENYDSVGGYRLQDRGMPVDASSILQIDGAPVSVNSALDLSEALAKSLEAQQCFAQRLLEFVFGRPRHANDSGVIARLAKNSFDSQQSVKSLLASLVTSQAFLNRSTQELP